MVLLHDKKTLITQGLVSTKCIFLGCLSQKDWIFEGLMIMILENIHFIKYGNY